MLCQQLLPRTRKLITRQLLVGGIQVFDCSEEPLRVHISDCNSDRVRIVFQWSPAVAPSG